MLLKKLCNSALQASTIILNDEGPKQSLEEINRNFRIYFEFKGIIRDIKLAIEYLHLSSICYIVQSFFLDSVVNFKNSLLQNIFHDNYKKIEIR